MQESKCKIANHCLVGAYIMVYWRLGKQLVHRLAWGDLDGAALLIGHF